MNKKNTDHTPSPKREIRHLIDGELAQKLIHTLEDLNQAYQKTTHAKLTKKRMWKNPRFYSSIFSSAIMVVVVTAFFNYLSNQKLAHYHRQAEAIKVERERKIVWEEKLSNAIMGVRIMNEKIRFDCLEGKKVTLVQQQRLREEKRNELIRIASIISSRFNSDVLQKEITIFLTKDSHVKNLCDKNSPQDDIPKSIWRKQAKKIISITRKIIAQDQSKYLNIEKHFQKNRW